MSTIVLTDARVFLGGYDLSGYANEVTLSQMPDILDSTVFGLGGTKRNTPGMRNFKGDVKGFMDFTYPLGAPSSDVNSSLSSLLFDRVNNAGAQPFSVAPATPGEGGLAYTANACNSKTEPLSGSVGQLVPFSLDVYATGIQLVRGFCGGLGAKTATGNMSAPVNIVGGIPAGSKLYAALHVIASSGTTPTLNVAVRSAAAVNMASPTTRITFPQFTTSVGASWQSVAGPITDAYFDVQWTIGGVTPSFTIAVVFGVGQ